MLPFAMMKSILLPQKTAPKPAAAAAAAVRVKWRETAYAKSTQNVTSISTVQCVRKKTRTTSGRCVGEWQLHTEQYCGIVVL